MAIPGLETFVLITIVNYQSSNLSHNKTSRRLLPTIPQFSIKRRYRPPLRLIPQWHKTVVEE